MKKYQPIVLARCSLVAVFACSLLAPLTATALPDSPTVLEEAEKVDAGNDSNQVNAKTKTDDSSKALGVTTRDVDGWTTAGSLKVKGGVYGEDYVYTAGPMQYRGSNYTVNGTAASNVLEILTDTPLTIADATPFDPANAANASSYGTTAIAVREGVRADLTFDGVHIRHLTPVNIITNSYDTDSGSKATDGSPVKNRTSLHLTLADGSHNALWSTTDYTAPIHCGEGSDFTLDDSVRNVDQAGNQVIPVGGVINEDVTLIGGKHLEKGQVHFVLDSDNPGSLLIYGVQDAASIGGNNCESGGRMTFNGGVLNATYAGSSGCAAGIGAGSGGNGTDTLILFNSGNYTVAGGYHGAGVGAACYDGYSGGTSLQPDIITSRSYNKPTVAGDITINGGYIRATGGGHGNGFGAACWSGAAGYNTGHTITVTGGTLYPTGSVGDLGGYNGYVVITGGSVYSGAGKFVGVGNTAWGNDAYKEAGYNPNDPNDPNKVHMMTINLKSEIDKRNKEADPVINNTSFDEFITSWSLTVGGKEYPYGAPKQFFDGQLFLWLPQSAFNQEVTVTLKYIDKNGDEQVIEPLFREPDGSMGGSVLKRFVEFDLPETMDLDKYYDGTPLPNLEISADKPIVTDDKKELTNPAKVIYKYQRYSDDMKTPLGPESASSANMPADAGFMKLTVDSTEWSNTAGFKESYWGHRATGWCEIKPIASTIELLKAKWVDEPDEGKKDGSNPHDANMTLGIEADIHRAATVDGKKGSEATKDTCKAPHGRVQLYVDGKPVGEPIDLLFADRTEQDGTVTKANATEKGDTTHFSYSFKPSEADHLVPDATGDNKHVVSLMYLPPAEGSDEPANYLESVNPQENPKDAPSREVAIDPIDPNPGVNPTPEPDNPAPVIKTDPAKPIDPDADPDKPGSKIYTGSITTTWGVGADHPGRVTIKVNTPSSGAIKITSDGGDLYEANFVCDDEGNPVKDENGNYTLVFDPTRLGEGKLTFEQAANGAYTETKWEYDVQIIPDPTDPDTDKDGLPDSYEKDRGTDPNNPDTDGDGIPDGEEEKLGTDPKNPDTDGDGLPDGEEIERGTDPKNPDTDGDGIPDGDEVKRGTDPKNPDTDGDGIPDGKEVEIGTDPTKKDTDGDGIDDGKELELGTDPLNPDTDGDGFKDGDELKRGTDPLKKDALPGTGDGATAVAGALAIAGAATLAAAGVSRKRSAR